MRQPILAQGNQGGFLRKKMGLSPNGKVGVGQAREGAKGMSGKGAGHSSYKRETLAPL